MLGVRTVGKEHVLEVQERPVLRARAPDATLEVRGTQEGAVAFEDSSELVGFAVVPCGVEAWCGSCPSQRYLTRRPPFIPSIYLQACRAGSLPENSGSAPSVGDGSAQSRKCAAAPKYAVGPAQAGTTASVFREFEVDVRPEPPPPPVAPDGRTAEDTLMGKMDFGGAGTIMYFLWLLA